MSYSKSASPESKVTVKSKLGTTVSISPQTVEVLKGQTVTFGGKLLDSMGNPLNGKTVHLYVGKNDVAQTVTDAGGNWQIAYTFAEEGTFKVKAVYEGD
jgi:plastocyanin